MIKNCIIRIWEFYRDGFREMTLGRTLWMLIFGFPLYLQHVHASCSYRDTVDFEEVK
jgi:hypothetical protein